MIRDITSYMGMEITELVRQEEEKYNKEIKEMAEEIIAKGVDIILLSGPSGSGKTTTANNLVRELNNSGKRVYTLSMDDWYKTRTREDIPRLVCGSIDYEHPESVDLRKLQDDIDSMLKGKITKVPTFDFKTSAKKYNGETLQIEEGGILLLEGIHAFNERINIEGKAYKVFIEPKDVKVGEKVITGGDLRLMRRIIRDNKYRNTNTEETIERKKTVGKGEELYIYPSKARGVDKEIDSFMVYELFLKEEGIKGYEVVRGFSGIQREESLENIPQGSILEEFYL